MTDTPENQTPQPSYQRRERRVSRYQRIQERRAAKKASDNRFYAGMFALMGLLALFVVLMGAIMINGAPDMGDGMQGWTTPWMFGWTKLEVAGVAFVGVIALATYLRMRKRG